MAGQGPEDSYRTCYLHIPLNILRSPLLAGKFLFLFH